MWTIAAVNKKFDGPLGSYNGLTDVHLAHFFSRPSRQSHLKSAKLITKDGFIVPEKNVKGEMHLDEKKRKVYDILARSILQNAIHEEGSWNKKLCNYLEDISKMAAVDKARKTIKKKSNKVASELFLEHPFFYSTPCENDTLGSPSKFPNTYRNLKPPNSAPVTCACVTTEAWQNTSKLKRSLSAKQYSPYGMPLILSGSYKEHMQSFYDLNKTFKEKLRKQRKINNFLRNSNNAKNILSNSYDKVTVPFQALKLSQCQITMLYHGRLHLTNIQKVLMQNILIKQQHCGGTPVTIYKGKISANELLSFFILDHEGFFFSLTVFLNGIRELKLSSCCVFRYLPGRRLGGSNGTFSIKKIEGGKPCLKCQYQEYESNELKGVFQSSQISVDTSVNPEISHIPENDIKNDSVNKTSLENYKPSSSEANIPLNDESQKVTSTESYGNDDIEEFLDEGKSQDNMNEISPESSIVDEENQNNKNEISPEDSIVDEEDLSSEEDEVKDNEDSDNSISSMGQSEISEKYVNDEHKTYQSLSTPEADVSDQQVSSSSSELDDLNFLHFPPDIDWSTTLVLRCDPSGAPYKLIDVANALHIIVRRNEVHNLGPTALNYAFTISFKTERSTENFVRYLKDRRNKPLTVKKLPCQVTRVPAKTVSVNVRWVPADVDTLYIVDALKQYGSIVKTDLVRNNKPGWFHVYTGERRFKVLLNDGVDVNALPFSLSVKGLYAAVYVEERNPKCLECYNVGHESETCKYKGCILFKDA